MELNAALAAGLEKPVHPRVINPTITRTTRPPTVLTITSRHTVSGTVFHNEVTRSDEDRFAR